MEKRLEPVLKARDDVIAEIEEKDRCKHRHEEIAGINKITASGGVEDATLLSKTAKVYIDGEPFPVEYTSRFSVVLEEAMKAGDTVPPQVQHVPGAHPRLVSLQKLSDTVEESRHEMKMGGIQSALAITMFLPVPGAQALGAGITAAKTAGITMATAAQVGKAAATALSGQEKVCGTKDWNKMDCPDYNEVLKRYKANMKRDKEGDYTISVTEFGGEGKKGSARDGVTGQCVGSEYQCDEKNEYGECIKGPASWMCNVVDATEVGGSENTTWLRLWRAARLPPQGGHRAWCHGLAAIITAERTVMTRVDDSATAALSTMCG
mmetsp:Transcript_38684/g.124927  ORF Transcript_38684/g.124927 Transcript_38684/m.124927 type:complete len:321 (+) Transcript_38684:427-1389(+)